MDSDELPGFSGLICQICSLKVRSPQIRQGTRVDEWRVSIKDGTAREYQLRRERFDDPLLSEIDLGDTADVGQGKQNATQRRRYRGATPLAGNRCSNETWSGLRLQFLCRFVDHQGTGS